MNRQNEVRDILRELEPWINRLISQATQNCVRRRTMVVATPPNGTTMGVREPYDETVLDLPYLAALAGAQTGDTVTIEWVYGLSNAVVVG